MLGVKEVPVSQNECDNRERRERGRCSKHITTSDIRSALGLVRTPTD